MTPDDKIRQERFAELTALFEDAAQSAADGQAPGLPAQTVSGHLQTIHDTLTRAVRILNEMT